MATFDSICPAALDITPEEEQKLWKKYLKGHDRSIRDQLIEHYAHLVYDVAERLAQKLPIYVSADDLIGWGNFGLIDAIERYELGQNTKFSTYAPYRILGRIVDEIRRLDETPRLVRQRFSQIGKAREELRGILGRDPYDEELIGALGISETEYHAVLKDARQHATYSLDSVHCDAEGEEFGKIELLQDYRAVDPLEEMQRREIKEVALRGLNEDEQKVLIMYYEDGLKMKEIGDLLGLSESRVCQIHKKVMAFLRDKEALHAMRE